MISDERVTQEEVLEHFRKREENARSGNPGVADQIKSHIHWRRCELSDDEFYRLELQKDPHVLLKDCDEKVEERPGVELRTPIILLEGEGEIRERSFLVIDGTNTALLLKKKFEGSGYGSVDAYIGSK